MNLKKMHIECFSWGIPSTGGNRTVGDEGEAADEGEEAREGCTAGKDLLPVLSLPSERILQAAVSCVPLWYCRAESAYGGGEFHWVI